MKKAKEKRNNPFLSLFCLFIICVSIISSFKSYSQIQSKNKEKADLTNQLEKLKENETTLSDDVEKLKNPEYAARYAREKYLYSKNGEKIIKIN